jgi:phage shock protein C
MGGSSAGCRAKGVKSMHGHSNIFMRHDTFFGVCQALGEDFGIPPNLFRLALVLGLFMQPLGAIAGYFALGLLVLISRLLAPVPRAKAAPAPAPEAAEPVAQTVPEEPVELAKAA